MTAPLRSPLRLVTGDDAEDYADDYFIPDDAAENPVASSRAVGERTKEADRAIRAALSDPARARAKYLEVASRSNDFAEHHALFHVLFALTTFASADLSNCFPSRKEVATTRFGSRVARGKRTTGMPLATLNGHLVKLRKAGWIRTHETYRADGRQSSSNVQFCIPRDVLPLGEPWDGPCEWTNRRFETERKSRK